MKRGDRSRVGDGSSLAAVAVVAVMAVAALALSACMSPIVGASCSDQARECGGTCVDVSSDPMNCGGCGIVCNGACVAGVCEQGAAGCGEDDVGGACDAARPDAGLPPDAAPADAAPADAAPAAAPDAVPSCDVGERRCDGVCVAPQTDPMNCGACGNVCAADEVCSAGTCRLDCQAPTEACGELCVDTQTDPDHCGSCGVSCASGICRMGACVAATAGHVVVIGHDYVHRRRGMNRLVGNAVFLALGDPVRVLVYAGDAAPAAVAGTNAAIDQVATESGRSWLRTTAETADSVPLDLGRADVFLVYAQAGATDATLQALGQDWRTALSTFVQHGGVVVVLDGAGDHSGTYQVLEPAGLFSATGRTDLSGDVLDVTAPGDSVATNVPVMYTAEATTVGFDTPEPAVVEDGGKVVVTHRVFY